MVPPGDNSSVRTIAREKNAKPINTVSCSPCLLLVTIETMDSNYAISNKIKGQ